MSDRERLIIFFILLLISVAVMIDLITDSKEGAVGWHLVIEGSVGLLSLFGTFYLLHDTFSMKEDLKRERHLSLTLKQEAEDWQSRSRKYLDGLSKAIDQQLSKWNLTPAEKEVAFLLLKGLSLKEIANVRDTSEKTARAQSIAIYSKAGLMGRSELAAFFLEDLLLPPSTLKNVSIS